MNSTLGSVVPLAMFQIIKGVGRGKSLSYNSLRQSARGALSKLRKKEKEPDLIAAIFAKSKVAYILI